MSITEMKQALQALESYHGYMEPLTTVFGGPIVPAEQSTTGKVERAITALRQAIQEEALRNVARLGQEIEQEPVAWMYDFLNIDNRDEVIRNWTTQDYAEIEREKGFNVRPLYTHPPKTTWVNVECPLCGDMAVAETHPNLPKREWVGLTDDDKQIAFDDTQEASGGFWEFADAIEAKLKEKNT